MTIVSGPENNDIYGIFMDSLLKELSRVLKRETGVSIGDVFGGGGKGGGGGGVIINVVNNAGAQVSVRETGGGMDQKQFEIVIDQMVANALVRGRQTSGVLGSLFNIVPGLSGR